MRNRNSQGHLSSCSSGYCHQFWLKEVYVDKHFLIPHDSVDWRSSAGQFFCWCLLRSLTLVALLCRRAYDGLLHEQGAGCWLLSSRPAWISFHRVRNVNCKAQVPALKVAQCHITACSDQNKSPTGTGPTIHAFSLTRN